MNTQNENKSSNPIIIIILTAVILIGAAVILIQCFMLSGASDEHPYLGAGDWSRYDADIGENLNITFTEEGEYFYACDCGEPVGNSDVYDSYAYNAKTGVITLSGPDGEKAEAKLIYCDENYLGLVIDGAFALFHNLNSPAADDPHESAESFIPENAPALSVLGFNEDKKSLTVAPNNYDGDSADSFEDAICNIELADKVDFYSVSVTDDNGEASVSKTPVMPYKYDAIGEDYSYGYVTFDDEGKVTGAIFYGELVIEG